MREGKVQKYDLTQGPIVKTVILYGIPILISQLIQYLYNFADTLIIGNRLGEQYMGAVNASGTTSGLLFSLLFGMTAGFAVTIGIAFGANREDKTRTAIVSSELLCIVFGLIVTVVGVTCAGPLVKLTKFPEGAVEVGGRLVASAEIARRYLTVIFAGAIVSIFNNMHTAILRTLGNSKAPVFILTMSAIVNIVLNLVFIEFTDLNEVGVALATVISQFVSALASLLVLFKTFPQFDFFRQRAKLSGVPWLEQIKIGIPMAFQNSLIMIGAVIVQTSVNELEASGRVPNAMASYAAANSVNNISSNIINTFGTVIAGYVSQNYGARDYGRIKKGITVCLLLSWALNLTIGALLLIFCRQVTGMFTNEWSEPLYENVRTFLLVNYPFFLIWIPVPIFRFAIQGMKNTLLPFLSCLVELPMRCVTAWVFGKYWGFLGVSFATPCALVASFVFLSVCFFLVLKRKKREMLTENAQM